MQTRKMEILRPFEIEILREIRTSPKRLQAGGGSTPRKGVWIRGHLEDVGRDYPYSMYKRWKSFIEGSGLNIKTGNYAQFRTYIYVLKRLGLIHRIERTGGSPFSKNYYALIPDKLYSPLWDNPFKHISIFGGKT